MRKMLGYILEIPYLSKCRCLLLILLALDLDDKEKGLLRDSFEIVFRKRHSGLTASAFD